MSRSTTVLLALVTVCAAARADQRVDIPLDGPVSHQFQSDFEGSVVIDNLSTSAASVAASPRLDGSAGRTVVTLRPPARLAFAPGTRIVVNCLWSASSDECGEAAPFSSSATLLPSGATPGFLTVFRTCHAPEDRFVDLSAGASQLGGEGLSAIEVDVDWGSAVETSAPLHSCQVQLQLVTSATTDPGPTYTYFPDFTEQPQSVALFVGQPLSLSATTIVPATYQWMKDGAPIDGATDATYSVAAAASSDAGDYTVVATANGLTVTSDVATVSFKAPPVIVTSPAGQELFAGQPLSLSVTATGDELSYEWRHDGSKIDAATGATYSVASSSVSDAGRYDVVVTNPAGSVTSASATVVVDGPPTIEILSDDRTVPVGDALTLGVWAAGRQLSYQWSKDGEAIDGATAATYAVSKARLEDAGAYTVAVANGSASVIAGPVQVHVSCATGSGLVAGSCVAAPKPVSSGCSSTGDAGGFLALAAALALVRRRRRSRAGASPPFEVAVLLACAVVACAGPSRRDDGSNDGSGSDSADDGGTVTPKSCVVPVGACTNLPKTQQLSQPCCPAYGVDACGAELFCAAFDGRTVATCYPIGSRGAESACDADDECSNGSCNLDACECRSGSFQQCDPAVGCTGGWGCDTTGATPTCQQNRLSGATVTWNAVISKEVSDETGSSALIEWSTAANDCQSASPSNARFMDVALGIEGSNGKSTAPTGPGTYTIYPDGTSIPAGVNGAYASLGSADANCQFMTQGTAESGTVTLTSIGAGEYAGYYSIRFPSGTLSDTFQSKHCDVATTTTCD